MGGRDTHAEEGQRSLEKDVGGDQQGGVDEDRGHQVRQQLFEQDVGAPRAETAGGVNELALPQRQRLPTDDPADVCPVEEADDENQQDEPQRRPDRPNAVDGTTPARARAKTSTGKARKTSMARLMTVSTQPPK